MIQRLKSRFGNPLKLRQLAISAFLLFHICAITFWCIPIGSPLIAAVRNVVRPYLLWAGLFQSWDMFAPGPKSTNTYIEAIIVYKDGHTKNWKFPRMEQLSFSERYRKERYRKFVENLKEENVVLWPDAARHIAWLNNDPANPPEFVILIRHWSDMAPHLDAPYHPEPWHMQILYEYKVKPADLT